MYFQLLCSYWDTSLHQLHRYCNVRQTHGSWPYITGFVYLSCIRSNPRTSCSGSMTDYIFYPKLSFRCVLHRFAVLGQKRDLVESGLTRQTSYAQRSKELLVFIPFLADNWLIDWYIKNLFNPRLFFCCICASCWSTGCGVEGRIQIMLLFHIWQR